MRSVGAVNHGLVIPEHVALVTDQDTHVPEGVTQIYDLFRACSCSCKL